MDRVERDDSVRPVPRLLGFLPVGNRPPELQNLVKKNSARNDVVEL